ncbi:Hypothetical predicted protein [Olea europaea subsp. europaea]|uniref:Uncharacterized protein n=2 Tax=Olea europaea subsp. europaea TaxID=158383 RepID=A0A8S0TDD6_OLEEU|nr:Hypothetical predicted protein [Olea europaea subsp. europaea]
METPLSTRRVTRSQTRSETLTDKSINTNNNMEISKSEKTVTKSRQMSKKKGQDRSAFMDITNDSPIVGLAMGNLKTPSSTLSKKRINCRANNTGGTPGSGEALLRGQVKSLLQKVEEEAELSKITLENKPFFNLGNSPLCFLAPTPANTPQILNLGDSGNYLPSVTPSPVEEKFLIPQSQVLSEILNGEKQDASESEKCEVTRSLLLEFFEKSDGSDSSVLTCQSGDTESGEAKLSTDDDASIWSVQVNASSTRDNCEEEEEVEKECDYNSNFVDEKEDDDEELLDELCEGIIKMNMNGCRKMVKFTGKHTRFVYGSDDELEGEEEVCNGEIESPVS